MIKEQYRRNLPHFHKGGQEFFITSKLKGAFPANVLTEYEDKIDFLKSKLENLQKHNAKENEISDLKRELHFVRNRHLDMIDTILAKNTSTSINLNLPENEQIMFEAFQFYEGKRLENHAFCVMRNHFHWVMRLFEEDENGKKLVSQDIMKLIHGVTARKINLIENKIGRTVWKGEAFETTIRNDRHWHNAIMYTINNPVKAGLVADWRDWKGTWCAFDF